jgi:hypothetical protein
VIRELSGRAAEKRNINLGSLGYKQATPLRFRRTPGSVTLIHAPNNAGNDKP